MQYDPMSIAVTTDRSEYASNDNVTITVFTQKNDLPASKERLQVIVYRPAGKRIFRSSTTTDMYGISVVVLHLDKNQEPGSYHVEVHSKDGSMGLSSFLVF